MKGMMLMLAVAVAVTAGLGAQAPAQSDEPVYEAGPGVTLPKAVKTARAYYTPEAMNERVQGRVVLRTVVSTEGRPTRIEVVESLDARLDREAVKALELWEFEPGTKDGKPVPVRISVEMTFTLK